MARRRSIRPLVLGILAFGLAISGQMAAQEREYPADALLLFLAAVLVFLTAFGGRPSSEATFGSEQHEEHGVARPDVPAISRWLAPDYILSAAVVLGALGLLGRYDEGFSPLNVFCWIGSVGLALLSAWETDRIRSRAGAAMPGNAAGPFRAELFAVAGVTLLAAFLRWYRLDSIPSGLWYDEAQSGLDALSVGKEAGFPVYFPANFGRPFLFIYSIAGLFHLFGASPLILRFAASIFGIATVPAIYWFARELFGGRAGLLAALLLAVSRWHINFSRIAFDAIAMPLFQILGFYFLTKAWRTGKRLDFALSALWLGVGLYSYAAFRLVPFIALFYLAHLWLSTRAAPRQRVWDLALAGLVLVLVAAPLGQYALRYPEVVNARVETVSIFSGRTLTQGLQAAAESARLHLLMFNVEGDHNGRHNLPGEPMLDPGTAALLVLGSALAILRWRQPRYLLPLAWTIVSLSSGIFALDFEAPQGLRSIGAIPAVLILASLPLAMLWEEAALVVALKRAKLVFSGLGAAGLGLVLAANFNVYFNLQANDFAVWNAFSTPESLVARELNRLGPGWHAYVVSLYAGHPTIRFLAPGASQVQSFETTQTLPLAEDGSSPVALYLDEERRSVYEEAKRLYPRATFFEFGLPGRPAVLYGAYLQPSDLARIQGMQARYFRDAQWDTEPVVSRQEKSSTIDWERSSPVDPPFGVEWDTVLRVPAYGSYKLGVRSTAGVQVWLDESSVLAGDEKVEGRFVLAEGNHALRVRAAVPSRLGQTIIYWGDPSGTATPIPISSLYVPPVSTNGLLGRYFGNDSWDGQPALQRIDPVLATYFHNTPLPRPYTVEWSGKLAINQAGVYRFGLECIGDTWLFVDKQPVLETHEENSYQESAGVPLEAGFHDIRIRFADRYNFSHINLYWVRPSGERQIVPTQSLFPPQGSYPKAAISATTAQTTDRESGQLLPTVQKPLAIWEGKGRSGIPFLDPRGVAVDKAGNVYVADTGNARIVKLNGTGEVVKAWGGPGTGDDQFEEPVAVAVDGQNNVWVLDSAPGSLKKFTADGVLLSKWEGDQLSLYHPRGLAIDDEDNLYIADTGGSRVLKLSPSGEKLAELGRKGSVEPYLRQPTGVGIAANGDVYAVDSETAMLQVYDSSGLPLARWSVPSSGSVHGQHLAVAADGSVYVTAPEDGLLLRFSPTGELIEQVGGRGSEAGQFQLPVGISLDNQGYVYVADSANNRIQKLGP